MRTELPSAYRKRMMRLLGDAYAEYERSLERPVYQGLRIHPRKLSPERFAKLWGEMPERVDWCPEGFYIRDTSVASRHPYYYAGLYYLQEPSAMAPASFLPLEEGDRVLDLCAAPGGKSTQLSARLNGRGLLVSNDISPSRAKALLKNLELFGSDRSVVLTESPHRLAQRFEGFFTKILVDAPCSGEGMFHKDPAVIRNWEQYGNAYYQKLQKEILESAGRMLAPGGQMIYSTCTFAPEEDEGSVQQFLDRHRDFRIVPLQKTPGMDAGHPEWIPNGDGALEGCLRLWPHRIRGEGHFVALLQRDGEAVTKENAAETEFPGRKEAGAFYDWCEENLASSVDAVLPRGGRLVVGQDRLMLEMLAEPMLKGLRVLRGGLRLGSLRNGRFEPSQAWAMQMRAQDAARFVSYEKTDPRVIRYLKGETLQSDAAGWQLIGVDGFPLGWGKGTGTLLKNKYLKGWRYLGKDVGRV